MGVGGLRGDGMAVYDVCVTRERKERKRERLFCVCV
jgi:hypothetical protein